MCVWFVSWYFGGIVCCVERVELFLVLWVVFELGADVYRAAYDGSVCWFRVFFFV